MVLVWHDGQWASLGVEASKVVTGVPLRGKGWSIRADDQKQRYVELRLATSVCQLRHDPMEQGPTEPHAGRSTFLVVRGAGITECLLVRGGSLLRTSFPGIR